MAGQKEIFLESNSTIKHSTPNSFETTTTGKPKLDPKDVNNSELVHRLLAATPAYLYSAPMSPHNFFFSEMLRSIVQAKDHNIAFQRNCPSQPSNHNNTTNQMPTFLRRPRKRLWSKTTELVENMSSKYNSDDIKTREGKSTIYIVNGNVLHICNCFIPMASFSVSQIYV